MKSAAISKALLLLIIYFFIESATSIEVIACEAAIGSGIGILPSAESTPVVKTLNICIVPGCGEDYFYLKDPTRMGIATDLYSIFANS